MKNGYIEKPFGKGKLALKFGVNAFEQLCKMYGVELHEIDKAMTSIGGERDLIFCAAQAAAWSSGKELKINKYQVGDWIEDMKQSDYDDIVEALMESKISGKKVKELVELAEKIKDEEVK